MLLLLGSASLETHRDEKPDTRLLQGEHVEGRGLPREHTAALDRLPFAP